MPLPLNYIAGFIEGSGNFIWVNQKGQKIPVFQLKCHSSNLTVLEEIKKTLHLRERVYVYNHGGRSYCLLLVRNRKSILDKIIPSFEGRLCGAKKEQFNEWKTAFLQKSSSWRFKSKYVSR